MGSKKTATQVRIIHRYLGFFLAGIMAVYAISGIILIFRNTDFLKNEIITDKQIEANLSAEEIGPALKMRVRVEKEEEGIVYLKHGTYNTATGAVYISKKELPFLLQKMQKLHKATTNSPLFYLNIFFGLSLLFFVLSAFWMYTPKMPIFKKGLYYTIGGIILTLILLFV
jgi:uncharacterized iron-regulated membrane protein